MDKKDNIFTSVLSIVVCILSIIGLSTIISVFSKKPSDTSLSIKNDDFLEVCGEQFMFNEYIDKYGLDITKMSDDINKTCEDYITFNLREEIEEELKNE